MGLNSCQIYTEKLPEDWQIIELGHILEERDIKAKEEAAFEAPILSLTKQHGLIPQEERFKKRVARSDVSGYKIIKRSWLVYNPFVIWEGAIHCLKDVDIGLVSPSYIIWAPKEIIHWPYLDFVIRTNSLLQAFSQYSYGVVQRRRSIKSEDFKRIKIPVPPLSEQKKIAYVLNTVQEAIRKTEGIIYAAKKLKKSLIKHLFTYGPITIDDVENIQLKETEIGMIPYQWDIGRIADLFEFSRKPRSLNIDQDESIPFISMEQISTEYLSVLGWKDIRVSNIKSGSFVWKGDLIIAKITPCFENEKQAILAELSKSYGYATTEVWALHPNDKRQVSPYYLFYYLKLGSVRNHLISKMEGSTGRRRLPRNVLSEKKIAFPRFHTQKTIIQILETIDNKIKVERDILKAQNELFKSLLENLMTAKLRVDNLGADINE